MDFLLDISYWVIASVLLILAELIVPGGIVIFLGIAGLLVAAALALGLVTTWVNVLTLWFISSLALILLLRSIATKFAPGDSSISNTDELLDELDATVNVVETIGPGEKVGRVEFRGSTWNAVSDGREIAEGQSARIVSRDNITLVVEEEIDSDKHIND